jgi:hypothetical protein
MERRQRRSDTQGQALFYQLDASRTRASLEAMILADRNGLCVAASGEDSDMCDEFAAHMAIVCDRVTYFQGSVLSPSTRREVHMQRFQVGDDELFLCAIGGDSALRDYEISRSASGVNRILAA